MVLRVGFVPRIQGDFTATARRFLRKTLCCILMNAEVGQSVQEGKHAGVLKGTLLLCSLPCTIN